LTQSQSSKWWQWHLTRTEQTRSTSITSSSQTMSM
jgi:hypothetical protein